MRLKYILLICLIVLILPALFGACGSSKSTTKSDMIREGDIIPYALTLTDLGGASVPMSSFKDKVLFINIWATWCPPCRKEMPSIQALHNRIQHPDVQFILISPEDINKLDEYLTQNNLDLPVFSISKQLPPAMQDEYIPRTYIIDRFGKVVHQHVGERDWNTNEIFEFINFLAATKVREN